MEQSPATKESCAVRVGTKVAGTKEFSSVAAAMLFKPKAKTK